MKNIPMFFMLIIIFSSTELLAQRISVEGTKFMTGGGEIFMNGVNTPWDRWNDFGGSYDHNFWDTEFQRIRNAGGNSSRIWITCNGETGIDITSQGNITGVQAAHWEDLDDMFALAQEHQVYIMATLISFDHTKGSHANYQSWRNMFASDDAIGTYIDNYLIPFVNRYKDNPYLWSIDACNEIEWMHENSDNGLISWDRLQYYVARVAAAVHQNSAILVTLGSAAVKWNSTCSGCEGNFWSDASLQAQYNSPDAYLDFYSPHFYGWVVRWFDNFALDKTPGSYNLTDRPCMVGENPATGVFRQNSSGVDELEVPIEDAFTGAYNNGWRGLMVWTSNGVDQFGDLTVCGPGLLNFYQEHPALVNPYITGYGEDIRNSGFVKVYPNPSPGFLYLNQDGRTDLFAEIYNLSGQKIFIGRVTGSHETAIDIRSFSTGIYMLIVSSGRRSERIKIIKR